MWNDFLLNGIRRRVGVLVVAALLGGKILAHLLASNWWFCWFPEGTHEVLAHVVAATPFTVPTFLALWWFRTYDSRQQLQRANFEAGVGQIVSDTPISIEVGTQFLIQMSKVTSAFDGEITLTFIKRLKRSPADTGKNKEIVSGGYRWGYAYQMLQWLQSRGEKCDLDNLDLRNQDFITQDTRITAYEILEMHADERLTVDVAGFDDSDAESFFGINRNAYERWNSIETGNYCDRRTNETDGVEDSKPQTNKVLISRGDYQAAPPGYWTKE